MEPCILACSAGLCCDTLLEIKHSLKYYLCTEWQVRWWPMVLKKSGILVRNLVSEQSVVFYLHLFTNCFWFGLCDFVFAIESSISELYLGVYYFCLVCCLTVLPLDLSISMLWWLIAFFHLALSRLLTSLQQANELPTSDEELGFLSDLLQSKELHALVNVHNKIISNGASDKFFPMLSTSMHVMFDCLEVLASKTHLSEDCKELFYLLQKPHVQVLSFNYTFIPASL